jgi:ribonuclease E
MSGGKMDREDDELEPEPDAELDDEDLDDDELDDDDEFDELDEDLIDLDDEYDEMDEDDKPHPGHRFDE